MMEEEDEYKNTVKIEDPDDLKWVPNKKDKKKKGAEKNVGRKVLEKKIEEANQRHHENRNKAKTLKFEKEAKKQAAFEEKKQKKIEEELKA